MVELHLTNETINQFGRYNDLISDLDINKSVIYFENKLGKFITKREARLKADVELRSFIINGCLEG